MRCALESTVVLADITEREGPVTTESPSLHEHLRDRLKRAVVSPWVSTAITLTIIISLVVILRDHMPFIRQGFDSVTALDPRWALASLVCAVVSMVSFAIVQRTLLHSANVPSRLASNIGLTFAANAWSTSIPGGQVVSTAMTFQETRKWGASKVIASWQLIISGVLSTIALLAVVGAGLVVIGNQANMVFFIGALAPLLAVLWVIQFLARKPHRVGPVLIGIMRWINRRLGKAEDRGVHAITQTVNQLNSVVLTPKAWSITLFFAALNWLADMACLAAAAYSVGTELSIGGLAIAYFTGHVVRMVPITPGGLGTVELALISTLTAGGQGANMAFATVFVYRVISFGVMTGIGWIVFAFGYASRRKELLEADDELVVKE